MNSNKERAFEYLEEDKKLIQALQALPKNYWDFRDDDVLRVYSWAS